MKRSLALLAFLTAGNVVAAQLTVAVTLAMDAGTLSDLAAAVARMNDAVPSRLVVRGIPLRAGWEKDAYWQAPAEKERVLKPNLRPRGRTLRSNCRRRALRSIPRSSDVTASPTPRSSCWKGMKWPTVAKEIDPPSSFAATSPPAAPFAKCSGP